MKDVKKIALVGIGGFGRYHYDRIKELEPHGVVKLVAVMILPSLLEQYSEMVQLLKNDGVRIYTSYSDMLDREKGKVDIVDLPVGIGNHCDMSIAALEAGYHVLCEKPMAGTLEECMRMKEAQERTGRLMGICFQNIYSPSIQRMKQIAVSGDLGALKSAKTCVLWQRADAYYRRTWAGRLVFEGKIINDCPLMNATSHYLNNMLYIAGKSLREAAQPVSIYGENYRVKNIESCDTQFLRVVTDTGARLTFITSHSTDVRMDPMAEYLFENGKIMWDFSGKIIAYRKTDGGYEAIEKIDGGDGNSGYFKMIYISMCDAIRNGTQLAAVANNSFQQVMCVDKSFKSGPIVNLPEEYVGETEILKDDDCLKVGDVNRYIKGILPLVKKMYAEEISFYEAGCPWAVKSQAVKISADALVV